jgi:hypothetical protein
MSRQAQFHPRKYLLVLTADLRQRGGTPYEATRVVGLTEGEPCEPAGVQRCHLRPRRNRPGHPVLAGPRLSTR